MAEAALFDDLRDAGHLVIDHPGRKLAVFANTSGQVALVTIEPGTELSVVMIDPEEVKSVLDALRSAASEAGKIAVGLEAEYATYLAIERAKG